MKKRYLRAFVIALIGAALVFAITVRVSEAVQPRPVTWYGPGYYFNHFACSGRPGLPTTYQMKVRGAAHPSWPCGSRVKVVCADFSLCKRRWVVVQVIDRCRCTLDLTQRSMQDMTGGKHYTIKARYWRVADRSALRPPALLPELL